MGHHICSTNNNVVIRVMAYIKRDEEADNPMPDGKEDLLPKDAEVEVDTLLA